MEGFDRSGVFLGPKMNSWPLLGVAKARFAPLSLSSNGFHAAGEV
jgi:hypothetical protein